MSPAGQVSWSLSPGVREAGRGIEGWRVAADVDCLLTPLQQGEGCRRGEWQVGPHCRRRSVLSLQRIAHDCDG
jgi:hypothetical protein